MQEQVGVAHDRQCKRRKIGYDNYKNDTYVCLQLIIIAKWLAASASKKAHATALASFSRATREGLACNSRAHFTL